MHDPTTDAKTVPMNLVVMPNSAGEHPTYEWQPRDGVYFSMPLLTVFALMLFLGGYAGYKYLVVATAVSVWWLGMALSAL